MTEDEAKTKWCPMVRHVPDAAGYASGNQFDGSAFFQSTRCKGSACMMWRVNIERQLNAVSTHNGYCGLAGKQ